jgi:hypothetical protein
LGEYTPQTFVSETDDNGAVVIYTNQANAVLRYTARVTDPTKFPPTFVQGLAMMLASMLAGPVLKGDRASRRPRCGKDRADKWLSKARESDANQQRQQVAQNTSWIANR